MLFLLLLGGVGFLRESTLSLVCGAWGKESCCLDGVSEGGAPPKALQPRAEQGGGNRLHEEKRRRRGCYTQSRVVLHMHLFPSFICVLGWMGTDIALRGGGEWRNTTCGFAHKWRARFRERVFIGRMT